MELKGIHHVSAVTSSASGNFEFYTELLGLRLVKKTVNQDETSVYHLFYGDEKGNPGTELTFFEFPMAAKNRAGTSSISALSLRVGNDEAIRYWKERFAQNNVDHDEIVERAGRSSIAFRDFEGQRLVLVSDEHNHGVKGGIPWDKSTVPVQYGILGLGPVQLTVKNPEPTIMVLTQVMGFREKGKYVSTLAGQPDIVVFETGEGGSGAEVHIEQRHDLPREQQGYGGVHHVAFRVEDDDELRKWIEHIRGVRIPSSGFVDRFYFRSLYFREPNGILFELATDGPGFDTDEDINHLGESLALPPFLEPKRAQIEARLKPLDTKPQQ
ncbi:ring-cleaving dioxygenase [Paenibacillus sp. FSL H8-0548]|uniref:ring-cleaving dioxygenase n=1 Tax=Paenibacillus sp. FSL H8-0548 TaxID=1920422 RepID=UPI00096F8008|nr:ring-cleaving dioxygenase [Paenibacillus sp. FSL H8-0548]OMF36860.1 ring-cleaving dioxygenase [Paenibacillus sp. FSL H8-0548]